MSKISIVGLEARDKAIKGLNYVADGVKSTLGPFGQNFMLQKGNKLTNDGFTISSELSPTLKDEFERRGALVAQETCGKVNELVGDATSTTWALLQSIVAEAIRYLPSATSIKSKKTPSQVIKEIEDSKNNILKKLEEKSKKIESEEELIQSALVSVENEEIAKLLGETQWKLGENGRIIAEEVNDTKSSIEIVEGIRLDNGFSAVHLITNAEKGTLEIDNAPIILTNYTIDVKDLDILKKNVFNHLIANKQYGVIIIARAFTSEAIKQCSEALQNGFAIFPINAPYVNQGEVMRDIEAVVGGKYIDTEEGSLEDLIISSVGHVRRIVARQMSAEIIGIKDEKSEKRIKDRIETLKKKLIAEESIFGKRMIEERIAQLEGGFGILKVGSYSNADRKRLKDKCDDAVNSVRLALKGGTIKGAGIALKEISDELEEGDILKRPIRAVYEQIIASAPEDFVVEDWVRDPLITIQTALEYAANSGSIFATTYGIITDEDKKKCRHDDEE